jgi:signal transduction histidine kinase
MIAFKNLSLSRQFLISSFPILIVGMLAIGSWIGNTITHSVLNRTAGVTSLYVSSFIAPHLQKLVQSNATAFLDSEQKAALDSLLIHTPLGQKIVSFKIWDRFGRVIYSTDPSLIGKSYSIGGGLAEAFDGRVHSDLSDLSEEEHEVFRDKYSRLIETYSPVHADKLGTVIAAAEFYQATDDLFREIRNAKILSWGLVAATMLAMYLAIFGLVRRGSRTILAQREQLNDKVVQLSTLVAQNTQLNDRVRRAAARSTELNERFLRRIASDLHDGTGQDLALALMRFESIIDLPGKCPACGDGQRAPGKDLRTIHTALQSALTDLRSISLGLQLPEIDWLPSNEIAARAVRDFERKAGSQVTLIKAIDPVEMPLPVKITLYRLIQESLSNGLRHGGATHQTVEISNSTGHLDIVVRDNGIGFDANRKIPDGHFGLDGMRERVEVLGGSFQLQTALGQGTVVRATIPIT